MLIALDFDGTLAVNSCLHLYDQPARWLDGEERPPWGGGWDFDRAWPPAQRVRFWAAFGDAAFIRTIPPQAHANEVVRELGHRGNSFVLLSDRPRAHFDGLVEWLDLNDFPMMTVVTTGWDNGVTKQQMAARFGVEIAIDDAPHHIEAYRQMGVTVLVPCAPYNEDEQDCLAFVDWREVLDFHWPQYRAVR